MTMPSLTNLLYAALALFILQLALGALEVKEPQRKWVWIGAIIVALLWLFVPGFLRFR